MLRVSVKYAPPILMAVAPLLTSQYSLLDLAGYAPDPDGNIAVAWLWYGPKLAVEMQVRVAVTLCGIGLILLSGYFDAYRPSVTLESFRHDYLSHVNTKEWRRRGRLRKSLRVNVMYLGWRWYMPRDLTQT